MNPPPHILYFCTAFSSFVKKDLAILGHSFTIESYRFRVKQKYLVLFRFITQFFFLLFKIWKADIVVIQFGGYHSFLPALFGKLWGKPALIITGGTDCVSFPSIGYGNYNKKLLGRFTSWSYRLASHISPVHETLMLTDYNYQDNDFPKQGLLYFNPGLKTPYTVIYNGYDNNRWKKTREKKSRRFITVAAGVGMHFTKKLKGLDLILEVAPLFPDCKFEIIGVPPDFPLNERSANIIKRSYVDNSSLPDFYSEAAFYLQLSMSEGFPNALCEAMLCECVPIVSDVGGMRHIINDTGFILRKKDISMLAGLLQEALKSDVETLGKKARERIAAHFPEEKRATELTALIRRLITKNQT